MSKSKPSKSAKKKAIATPVVVKKTVIPPTPQKPIIQPAPIPIADLDPTEPGLPWEELSPEERSPLRYYLD
ncbi:MAG: hypothetical protein D4R66_06665, partial [Opitutales bacterium]